MKFDRIARLLDAEGSPFGQLPGQMDRDPARGSMCWAAMETRGSCCYPPRPVNVTDEDRAYMARIGACKEASHAEAQARHLALPISERLRRSWALFALHGSSLRREPDDHWPAELYARVRALGLYRP